MEVAGGDGAGDCGEISRDTASGGSDSAAGAGGNAGIGKEAKPGAAGVCGVGGAFGEVYRGVHDDAGVFASGGGDFALDVKRAFVGVQKSEWRDLSAGAADLGDAER